MTYSLQQAADATGKSKSTIQRAIKAGKVSANLDPHGNYQIDPAELHRVYPPEVLRDTLQEDERDDTQQANSFVETEVLRVELQQAREQLATLNLERDRERRQAEDVVADLRRRLDVEGEERRKLTAILTDQRTKEPDPPPDPAPLSPQKPVEGLWGRLRYLATGKP